MNIESIIISACVTVLAIGLMVVSLISYRKHRSTKLLFTSLVFLLFFIKGILFSINAISGQFTVITSTQYLGLFDLLILIILFLATLKR